jgi:hypothetical protein
MRIDFGFGIDLPSFDRDWVKLLSARTFIGEPWPINTTGIFIMHPLWDL